MSCILNDDGVLIYLDDSEYTRLQNLMFNRAYIPLSSIVSGTGVCDIFHQQAIIFLEKVTQLDITNVTSSWMSAMGLANYQCYIRARGWAPILRNRMNDILNVGYK